MDRTRLSKLLAGLCPILLIAACGGPLPVGGLDQAVVNFNTLNPNTLNPNTLNPNTLNPNTLNPNTLNPNTLNPNSLAAITEASAYGAMSRELVRYLVGCALEPSQVFSFTWTDESGTTHDENYQGILSLAPEWATGPLSPTHEPIVSACVASRVNYYATPVEISSRAPAAPLSVLDATEASAYPNVEGAFWGNLFAPTPWVRTCGLGANAANSRAWNRDCAVGHLNGQGGVEQCGIMAIAGDCATLCDPLDPNNKFYPQCADPQNGAQTQVITTALPSAANPGAPANLALVTVGPASVVTEACTTITYTSTITSTGTATVNAPVFTNALPTGLTVDSITASLGTCAAMGTVITCNLPNMAPGQSATITVQATALITDQSVTNFTTVVSPTTESSQSDNTATVATALQKPAGTWEQASATFNATPIAKGSTIWFTTTLNPGNNIPAGTVWTDNGTITFQANGVTYTIPVPSGKVVFANNVTTASTAFDHVHHRWETTVPASLQGAALLSAVAWTAPVDLPGGIQNVTMSTHLAATQSGITVGWQWAAAVYSSFGRDYGAMTVTPSDVAAVNPGGSTHAAGTPESHLGSLVAGALNGGGSYVGTRTTQVQGAPDVVVCQ